MFSPAPLPPPDDAGTAIYQGSDLDCRVKVTWKPSLLLSSTVLHSTALSPVLDIMTALCSLDPPSPHQTAENCINDGTEGRSY